MHKNKNDGSLSLLGEEIDFSIRSDEVTLAIFLFTRSAA